MLLKHERMLACSDLLLPCFDFRLARRRHGRHDPVDEGLHMWVVGRFCDLQPIVGITFPAFQHGLELVLFFLALFDDCKLLHLGGRFLLVRLRASRQSAWLRLQFTGRLTRFAEGLSFRLTFSVNACPVFAACERA